MTSRPASIRPATPTWRCSRSTSGTSRRRGSSRRRSCRSTSSRRRSRSSRASSSRWWRRCRRRFARRSTRPGSTSSPATSAARRPQPAEAQERPQQSGVDTRAWREMRTSPIFDGLPNEALRDALMSGDAHVLRLSRDSLVPMDGSVALVRSGQVAIARFAEEALAAERKAAHAVRATAQAASWTRRSASGATRWGRSSALAEQNLATFEDGDVVETAAGARPPHDAGVLHGDAGGGHHHPARPRRPVEAHLSVHGRSLPPRRRRRRAPRSRPPTAPSPRSPTSSSATACRCR